MGNFRWKAFLEAGESEIECARREIKELNIELMFQKNFQIVFKINLTPFLANYISEKLFYLNIKIIN
jgi:hypothetical protein